jgi:hypothetical protein
MDSLIFVAVGLEIAVSVVALIIYYSPISWRYRKQSLVVPSEVREMFNLPSSVHFNAVQEVPLKLPRLVAPSFEVLPLPTTDEHFESKQQTPLKLLESGVEVLQEYDLLSWAEILRERKRK